MGKTGDVLMNSGITIKHIIITLVISIIFVSIGFYSFVKQTGVKKKEYIIQWKSSITGHIGQGTTKFSLQDAQEICSRVNCLHPELNHWIREL